MAQAAGNPVYEVVTTASKRRFAATLTRRLCFEQSQCWKCICPDMQATPLAPASGRCIPLAEAIAVNARRPPEGKHQASRLRLLQAGSQESAIQQILPRSG